MIKKKFNVFTITADKVSVIDNKTVIETLPTVTTTKKVTDKNAEKVYRQETGTTDRIFITSVSADIVIYEMDNETFMKYGKAIEV